jgi:hypothetical protein
MLQNSHSAVSSRGGNQSQNGSIGRKRSIEDVKILKRKSVGSINSTTSNWRNHGKICCLICVGRLLPDLACAECYFAGRWRVGLFWICWRRLAESGDNR